MRGSASWFVSSMVVSLWLSCADMLDALGYWIRCVQLGCVQFASIASVLAGH